MRHIIIGLFLLSFGSVSMGGVGDVYFCNQEYNYSHIPTKPGASQINQKKTLKFQIKEKEIILKTKYGPGGYDNQSIPIHFYDPQTDEFVAILKTSDLVQKNYVITLNFTPPILGYTGNGNILIKMYSASCTKF